MDKKGFSIIICCYNSADRISTTLKALSKLKVDSSFSYEVIIVDNNCIDKTVEVAINEWSSLNVIYPLKIVTQKIPGLNHAREMGLNEATYSYIVFCDDDNLLQEDYLLVAKNLLELHSDVGIIGGQGVAVCEVNPPVWFEKVKSAYAVGKKDEPEGILKNRESFIAGAGMVLKKEAWDKICYAGYQSFLTDRKGKELTSGGDIEFSYAIKMAGYALYYTEKLVFYHFIPKERLNWQYIIKGCKGYGKAVNVIESYLYVMQPEIRCKEDIKKFFNAGVFKNVFLAFTNACFNYLRATLQREKNNHEEIAFFIRLYQLKTAYGFWIRNKNILINLIHFKKELAQSDLSKVVPTF